MRISVEVKCGTEWVARAMRSTMGKVGESTISGGTFRHMLMAGHSPAEEWEVWIDAIVPERVHTHVVRHKDIGKYVATSRPDIVGDAVGDGNRVLSLRINGKRLIEIMRVRLCGKAWYETLMLFRLIAEKVIKIEPAFRGLLAPTCVWYGFCPEESEARKCCGFIGTDMFEGERGALIGMWE